MSSSSTVVPQPNTPPKTPPLQATRPQDATCCLAHPQIAKATSSSFQDAAYGCLDATTSHRYQTAPDQAQSPSARPPTTSAASKSSSQHSLHSLPGVSACGSPTAQLPEADMLQQPRCPEPVFTAPARDPPSHVAPEDRRYSSGSDPRGFSTQFEVLKGCLVTPMDSEARAPGKQQPMQGNESNTAWYLPVTDDDHVGVLYYILPQICYVRGRVRGLLCCLTAVLQDTR